MMASLLMILSVQYNMILLIILTLPGLIHTILQTGPIFLKIPPTKVEFLNSNGWKIDCSGHAYPDPVTSWLHEDGSVVRSSEFLQIHANGNLEFLPFTSKYFNQDIHSSTYRCEIRNKYGAITSPPVKVIAASQSTLISPRVYDEYVVRGCTAVLRCQLPGYAKDNLKVVSWMKNNKALRFSPDPEKSAKYVLTQGGHLHISNVNQNDEYVEYKCKIKHTITSEEKISEIGGKIHLTDTQNALQAKINDFEPLIRVKEGESVIMPCAALGQPTPKIRWHKLGNGSKSELRGKILNVGSLMINKVSAEDNGIYECHVSNNIGTDSRKTRLIVYVELQAYILPERQIVDIGKSLSITCSVSGTPINKITWYKNAKLLTNIGKELKIEKTSEESVGSYQCFIENENQIVQATTSVFAGNIKPTLLQKFSGKILHPGSTLKLTCRFKGLPRPTIKWFLDGKMIIETDNKRANVYSNEVDETTTTLEVLNSRVLDGGEYGCIAENKIGVTSHFARIDIYGKPKVRRLDNITVADGENVHIRCYWSGYPISKIVWTKDSRGSRNRRIKSFNNGTLIIENVKMKKDEGRYKCTVYGVDDSEDFKYTSIKVLIAPVLRGGLKKEIMSIGDSMTLFCNILRGSQPIDLQWLKNNRSISFDHGIIASKTSLSSVIQVKSVTKYHGGNYTCVANNTAGNDYLSVEVIINSPPIIHSKETKFWFHINKEGILNCNTSGSPIPVVEWYRNEEILENSMKYTMLKNGSLKLENLEKADEGLYSCYADNGLSPSASLDIEVFIGKSPELFCEQRSLKNSSQDLSCTIKSLQPCIVTWFKNKEIIRNESYGYKDLLMNELKTRILVSKSDSVTNIYKVHVQNSFGKSDYNFMQLSRYNLETFKEEEISKRLTTSPNFVFTKIHSSNNFINSELNEAPILDMFTSESPKQIKDLASKESQDHKKITFFQILTASISTAMIILLFVLLLILIILWKKRSDKREEERNRYYEESEKLEEYDMNTLNSRYGQLRPKSARSFDSLPCSNYYSSITPYASFDPTTMNSVKNWQPEDEVQ